MPQKSFRFQIRNIPIAKRIILLVFLVAVIPIIGSNLLNYSQAYNAVKDTATDYNIQITQAVKQNISLLVNTGTAFADELVSSAVIRDAVINYDEMDNLARNNASLSILTLVRSKGSILRYVKDVLILTRDNETIYSMSRLVSSPTREAAQQSDYEHIAGFEGNRLWFLSDAFPMQTAVLAQKVAHIGTGEVYGYILIYMDTSFLTLSSGSGATESRHLTLVDPFGNDLRFTGEDYSEQELQSLQAITREPQQQAMRVFAGDPQFFICYSSVSSLDWVLVSSTPYSYLMQPISAMRYSAVALVFLLLILCLLISRIIIGSITRPLNNMIQCIREASETRFEQELVDNGRDELSYLAQAYNSIFRQVQELVVQIQREQAGKRSAEIRMLQAQINPHFLFNTLDSLRFTAMMSNANSVSDGLAALSHLLRSSILQDDPFISLAEELSNIQDYLTIQRIRQGSSILLQTELDDDAPNARIMKLLLQPIVENSVIHGRRDEEELLITVSARREGDMLRVIIRDNGCGFAPQEALPGERSHTFGIGLSNVRERLALEYRDRFTFTIDSAPGQGTTVTITQPYDPIAAAPKKEF